MNGRKRGGTDGRAGRGPYQKILSLLAALFPVFAEDAQEPITIDNIRYIEAMSEYLRICCDDKDKPVIVLLSMKKIEEHLPSSKFMRIHRSFIINLNKINEIKKNHVVIEGDVSLPIGDNYKDAFMTYLNKKILTK